MEKDNNYSAPPCFNTLDYSLDQQYQHLTKFRVGETSGENNNGMVDNYMPQTQNSGGFYGGTTTNNSFDKMSFADVMQFADFGPKLALKRQESEIDDPVYFLKFPVLNNKTEDRNVTLSHELVDSLRDCEETRVSDENNSVQLVQETNCTAVVQENSKKRKRPRTVKTSEEVESQRMTHIAVERNRRKQMNEHLRVLRSLMPGSYVQRGDQASIIGGAIEFVRELEQLLQCLESQKRRRLVGETQSKQVGESTQQQQQQQQAPFFQQATLPNEQMETGLEEETAESKSCLADVEVKVLGFDAMIKILSRRRPGQLIKTIAALEDMQLIILHTNITTIEQTVLYSFNVKVASDTRFTAEDIATSVQQILSFIHANTSM
ncbi:transcription factor FAMA isoform X2 [Vicia villosa]|uniref:transcription factor FAMA isoform X2 n=1 Tax=Vicia villosa TaxID=3911 RepID=UPI00273AC087|nr:transcription factor FAMA isoform X2 [Vicia villosa]